MSVLYVVLPLALLLVSGAVAAFLWAARAGQFDDLDTPPLRAVQEDESASHEALAPDSKSAQNLRA